ncbi:HAD-IA family hydrolase [Piscinibacter gummiphilus]|uniref:Glycerol-3-phosphatase n=1 Tax=Piscinibacter gummiphilus TaxID=946333 RepID=A0A1W6L369_9BURK|nr:HAD-IA family hydrolase [Piscinibacter gummiphilus]ARN18719.1 glycerol-3-phosphatase [Piscinibacter gummiphilus]ATU63360.1 glycerol-3-phosphatase [Piscinibacter gummiphilus]GLS95870.1 glycerol-3-phosphatase [Piscinibacter gummiphilus]
MTHTPFPDRRFAACLFDMDGTLLTSILAAERVWAAWARRHGLDVDTFLPTIHGVRCEDTVRRQNLPGIDVAAEVAWVTEAEITDTEGVAPIPGAPAFLASLHPDRWAVVTSASRALATVRLAAAGLPVPAVMVTAEDVERGKPAPDGYQLAARRLGVAAEDCLVFEDAPAGIAAGEAAGAAVLVITATHSHPVASSHPVVADYQGLQIPLR